MRRIALAVCLTTLSVPSMAQTVLENAYLGASLSLKEAALETKLGTPDPIQKTMDVINAAMAGMKSRGSIGAGLVATLEGYGVVPAVGIGQAAPCAIAVRENDGKSQVYLLCSESIGKNTPAYASLHIAEQAALLRLSNMPQSAEKDYMVVSLMTRSWIEMGGQIMTERKIGDRMQAWWDAHGSMEAYAQKRPDRPTLAKLLETNLKGQKTTAALIAEKQARLAKAACESEERGLYKEIRQAKDVLDGLKREEASLRAAAESCSKFSEEEDTWIQDRMPT